MSPAPALSTFPPCLLFLESGQPSLWGPQALLSYLCYLLTYGVSISLSGEELPAFLDQRPEI